MSSSFVRPTSIHKHKKQINKVAKRSKVPRKRKKWMTYTAFAVGLALVIWWVVDMLLLRNDRYIIRRIEVINAPTLFRELPDHDIAKAIQGKHAISVKRLGLLKSLTNSHPIISGIKLEQTDVQGLYRLYIDYDDIELRFRFQDQEYGLSNGILYPVQEGEGFTLLIDSYSTGQTLSGMFYKVPPEQLVKQYNVILNGMKDNDIQVMRYHPASSQIQVNTSTQEVYFRVTGNIFEQLKKYNTLIAHKDRVPNQRIIDLGATDEGVFVYP